MTKYDIKKGFIIQKLDQKANIFDGEESVLYTFNETATFIFAKLKQGWTKEKIVESLVKKYGIKRKRAQKDLDALVNDLLTKKIITQKKE